MGRLGLRVRHVLENPLLDWLNRWGEAKGYSPDSPETFDERTDFRTFIFRKGNEFEQAPSRRSSATQSRQSPESHRPG